MPGLDDVTSDNGAREHRRDGPPGQDVRDSLRASVPLAAESLPHVGHFVTRNRGTVGGSIAHADAAAELPLALVATGGSVVAASTRGRREIPADEFFLGPYTTALEPDELVVESVWPISSNGDGFAFEELAQRSGDYALAWLRPSRPGGRAARRRRAGVDRPTLLEVDPERPGESAAAQVEPWGSIHASPAYLKHLVRVLVDRAVAQATERAA